MIDISQRKVAQIVLYGHEMERGERELRGFIETLTEEELQSLIAVLWIGRGSFEAEDLGEALLTVRQEWPRLGPDYMLGSPHFPDHLENGMEALGLPLSDQERDLL